jgi:hypothetical protein
MYREARENPDYFCPADCEHLDPAESSQTRKKEPHICRKYQTQVYHEIFHPKLVRCNECQRQASNNK